MEVAFVKNDVSRVVSDRWTKTNLCKWQLPS